MAKKQFKAESRRLLDLMINSIYTHKEIFLRELISNASDAIDKRYYNAMTEGKTGLDRAELPITITADKTARTLLVSDSGIGMTRDEAEQNLGTIAKSGSLAFKENTQQKDDIDIIGQFGVGFYSAFMVASHVQVRTRSAADESGWLWESDGADGYTLTPCDKEQQGTEVLLALKEDTEDEKYSEFLDEWRLRGLIKKYSDYIRYPIQMMVEKHRKKENVPEGEPEWEDYLELETVNSMVPIWKKGKSEVGEEELSQFYKDKFYDMDAPLATIRSSVEGLATYTALLFVPAHAPYNFYSKDYEKGLQLYASGVLIMDKCADLLPDYFSFVRGLVDSQDLSLNISREMLQHDRQLKVIAQSLEKKIKSELAGMLENDREKYESFFKDFGLQLKYGIYSSYGMAKETLQDLLLFASSRGEKPVTLKEYVEKMHEEQKVIYYACGETTAKIGLLPQTELLREKGYEVLYLTEDMDEFCLKAMGQYGDKSFKSVQDGELDLVSEEEKETAKKQTEDNRTLLDAMKEVLGDKVADVTVSTRLRSHPVCLSAKGEVSIEMEKVLAAMPGDQKVKAQRVLELNPDHPVFATLNSLLTTDKEKLATYTKLLYGQALLIEGLTVEDPVAFANDICGLM